MPGRSCVTAEGRHPVTIVTPEPRGPQLSNNETSTASRRNSGALNSCFYEGVVRHRRFSPVPHTFRNRLYLLFIDLNEVDDIFDGWFFYSTSFPRIAQFRRTDFLGDPSRPIVHCVREVVLQKTGRTLNGPVRLLTHVRYFGFVFNPVSVYYCYDQSGQNVEAIVAEVTNTPWGEKHCYVIPAHGNPKTIRFECAKEFHVSPFMPMDLMYRWRITHPSQTAVVRLECFNQEASIFDAILVLKRLEFTPFNRLRSILRFPAMTLRVVIAIYWQAFRLWMKKAPFFAHPVSVEEVKLERTASSPS